MCIQILPGTTSAIITSFDESTYDRFNVAVGQLKYKEISRNSPNNYTAKERNWESDGSFFYSDARLEVQDGGNSFDEGSTRWVKR